MEAQCQTCTDHVHVDYLRSACLHCGHLPRRPLFKPPQDLPRLHKLQLSLFTLTMPKPELGNKLLAESSIIRRRTYCDASRWRPQPPNGHEVDAFDADGSSANILARIGDIPMGYARWRLVGTPAPSAVLDVQTGLAVAPADLAAAATAQGLDPATLPQLGPGHPSPCIDRLLVAEEYKHQGYALVVLARILLDILAVAGQAGPGSPPAAAASAGSPQPPTERALSMAEKAHLPATALSPACWSQVRCFCPLRARTTTGAWLEKRGFTCTGRLYSADPSAAVLAAPLPEEGPAHILEYSLNLTNPGLPGMLAGVMGQVQERQMHMPCVFRRILAQGAEPEDEESDRRRFDPYTEEEIRAERAAQEKAKAEERKMSAAERIPGVRLMRAYDEQRKKERDRAEAEAAALEAQLAAGRLVAPPPMQQHYHGPPAGGGPAGGRAGGGAGGGAGRDDGMGGGSAGI